MVPITAHNMYCCHKNGFKHSIIDDIILSYNIIEAFTSSRGGLN